MDRRDFFKFTAATGATATLASCGNPENQLIRFIPEEPLTPGIASFKPSICPLCTAGCGIQVRIMEGEAEVIRNGQTGILRMALPKKLEGNPAHPISQGRLCPRGQAAIQLTYHPDRITQPLKRTGPRGSGQFQPVSWDDAIAELVSQLDSLSASGKRSGLGFLTRPLKGQRQALVGQFLQGFGAPSPIVFETFSEDVLRTANARSFGYAQLPTFDLAQSRYVLSLGSDFLGTWNSPVAQSLAYGAMRQGRPGIRGKFVQAEPRMSQTGANADEFVAIRPGTEGAFALGIAHLLLAGKVRNGAGAARAGALVPGWTEGLPAYTPDAVEKLTGVAAAKIERIAREFAENGPAVAIIGGAPLAHTNGMFQALAVNALNALAGSVGTPGGVFFTPRAQDRTASSRSVERLAADLIAGSEPAVQLLLVQDANPVFGTPLAWKMKEALQRIPYIASFGGFLDETSSLADLILPDHSFLESWMDDAPETGALSPLVSVAPPAMRPLHQTRATPDVLIEISQKLSQPLNPALAKTYEEMVQAAVNAVPASLPEGTTDKWAFAQQQGGLWAGLQVKHDPEPAPAASGPLQTTAEFDSAADGFPLHFLPYPSQAFLDGSLAHLPWLQELPDVVSTAMWSTWVELHPKTAADAGIAQGDLVEISSNQGKIEAPALISPGIAPDLVAMPVGQGHENFTRYATGRGSNPLSILAPMKEAQTGALAWAATRVRISRAASGNEGQRAGNGLVLFAGSLREHDEEHR